MIVVDILVSLPELILLLHLMYLLMEGGGIGMVTHGKIIVVGYIVTVGY
jgi:hypothetical protein